MAVETITEHGGLDREPEAERDDSNLLAQADAEQAAQADAVLRAHATATIKRLLEEHPAVAKAIKDALRTRVYLRELAGRTNQAEVIEADTEQHEANLAVKLDPGDHRVFGFELGLAIVVALVILDAVPLNWAAQAFGLDSAGTWLVTFILVVASVGAMLGFEITRSHPRRRGVLAAVVAVAYLALPGLRTEFLITVSSESLPVALLQSTPADRHLGWPRPVRFGGPGPDLVPQPFSRRCPARGSGRRRCSRSRAAGRREAPAAHRQPASHAPPVGAALGRPGGCRPRQVGGRARAGHPRSLLDYDVTGRGSPLPAHTDRVPRISSAAVTSRVALPASRP